MAETLKTRIIELLSRDLASLHSISDIAKRLGVAYSHAHSFVKQLVAEQVLTQQKIGNTIVCRLNGTEPSTGAYLALISYAKTAAWQKKDARATKIMERVARIRDDVHCVLLQKSRIILIVPQNIKGVDFSLFKNRKTFNAFTFMQNRRQYDDCIVIHGAEAYWNMLLEKR